MSLGRSANNKTQLCMGLLILSLIAGMSTTVFAQDDHEVPKYELFTGYQWLNPGGTVPSPFLPPTAAVPLKLKDEGRGLGTGLTYNFNRYLGLEGDLGTNWNSNHDHETTFSVGPKLTWRNEGVNLFAHTLLGYNRLSPSGLNSSSGIGAILGGGIDLNAWKRVSIRLIEADYVWAHHNFADSASPSFPDLRRPSLSGARLRTGLIWNFGYGAPAALPSAACSVNPSEVMVGEPITATATGSNFNPKHTLTYSWASTGGKITGKDGTATIDTNGVAGGSYTVTAHITDAKMKKGGDVSCSANFTVKEPPKNPPTMSCSANPTTLQTGGTSAISCTCSSPDGVPVTVSGWTATGGSISGSGNMATLNTAGASPGPITVSATCSDSRGLTAPASTQVTVENPPPPPPQASKLSECDFSKMTKIGKPWRVDNECKAILDDVAKNLQQNADNKLVIVGNAEPTEKRKNLAAERALNSKAYLSSGESQLGIDASRIETRTGGAGSQTAEFWIVPAGATFPGDGTQAVDESKVKPVPDHPKKAPAKKK